MPSVDLNNIKDTIQSVLEAANTTTATTYLSNGLQDRVGQVTTVNLTKIPMQASYFPLVTTFINSKTIKSATIGRNQTGGKRKAVVNISIVGLLWRSNMVDELSDPADDEIQILMENVEEIMRENPQIASSNWAIPSGVVYDSVVLDEEAHLRAGIMTLESNYQY